MKVRLVEEHEQRHPRLNCADHGFPLVFEDGDEYGAVYLCPVVGCGTAKYDGLSSDEVYRKEQGVGYS